MLSITKFQSRWMCYAYWFIDWNLNAKTIAIATQNASCITITISNYRYDSGIMLLASGMESLPASHLFGISIFIAGIFVPYHTFIHMHENTLNDAFWKGKLCPTQDWWWLIAQPELYYDEVKLKCNTPYIIHHVLFIVCATSLRFQINSLLYFPSWISLISNLLYFPNQSQFNRKHNQFVAHRHTLLNTFRFKSECSICDVSAQLCFTLFLSKSNEA